MTLAFKDPTPIDIGPTKPVRFTLPGNALRIPSVYGLALFRVSFPDAPPPAPALIREGRLPCVGCVGAPCPLVCMGSGNGGWKVERVRSGYFHPWLLRCGPPAPGHILQPVWQPTPCSLLFRCPAGHYHPSCCHTFVSILFIRFINYPNGSVPSALCWDHN